MGQVIFKKYPYEPHSRRQLRRFNSNSPDRQNPVREETNEEPELSPLSPPGSLKRMPPPPPPDLAVDGDGMRTDAVLTCQVCDRQGCALCHKGVHPTGSGDGSMSRYPYI